MIKRVGDFVIAEAYELVEFYSWRRKNLKHWMLWLLVCPLLFLLFGVEETLPIAVGRSLLGLFSLIVVCNLIVMLTRPQRK